MRRLTGDRVAGHRFEDSLRLSGHIAGPRPARGRLRCRRTVTGAIGSGV